MNKGFLLDRFRDSNLSSWRIFFYELDTKGVSHVWAFVGDEGERK